MGPHRRDADGPTLIDFGTPEQQARFLPGIREGKVFWCQGYSEPGAGSDLAAIRTRCWLEDGKWHLQGQGWTSLAHESEWIFVIARSTPAAWGGRGSASCWCRWTSPAWRSAPSAR